MEQLKNHILDSRKIVIKIGSNVLSDKDGAVNKAVIHNIVEQVNSLMEMGKQVILVSSGARYLRSRSDQQMEQTRRYQLQVGAVRYRAGRAADGIQGIFRRL